MSKKNLFITGISGCVGHYVWDELKDHPDYHLYLLVRNPDRLRFKEEAQKKENVTIIQASMDHMPQYADLLKTMDLVVHMATDWGGDMNYEHTITFFNLLDPKRCQKVIYFSTASILGVDNKPITNAEVVGTAYIRRKWLAYKTLPSLEIYPKMKILFPTLILGGDKNHPFSHANNGLPKVIKWMWLLRFFSYDGSFHFIHAADIALMVKYLLENDTQEKEYVLGQDLITYDELIKVLAKIAKKKVYFGYKIKPSVVLKLIKLFKIKINDWDEYCLRNPHLKYQNTYPESLKLSSKYRSIEESFIKTLGFS